jgi:hypothetical protein
MECTSLKIGGGRLLEGIGTPKWVYDLSYGSTYMIQDLNVYKTPGLYVDSVVAMSALLELAILLASYAPFQKP